MWERLSLPTLLARRFNLAKKFNRKESGTEWVELASFSLILRSDYPTTVNCTLALLESKCKAREKCQCHRLNGCLTYTPFCYISLAPCCPYDRWSIACVCTLVCDTHTCSSCCVYRFLCTAMTHLLLEKYTHKHCTLVTIACMPSRAIAQLSSVLKLKVHNIRVTLLARFTVLMNDRVVQKYNKMHAQQLCPYTSSYDSSIPLLFKLFALLLLR